MRLYPKVIPIIAREAVQLLMQDRDIEVEPMRIADAEMDLSAIMREYLANEERVNQATREALERRGYDYSKFNQVKREMADVRGFKMGDEGIEYVINQMIEFLLISRNVEEVFSADNVLRQKIFQCMKKHLDVDDEIDREARARLKHLQEGTSAFDIEYNKTVEQIRRARGLIPDLPFRATALSPGSGTRRPELTLRRPSPSGPTSPRMPGPGPLATFPGHIARGCRARGLAARPRRPRPAGPAPRRGPRPGRGGVLVGRGARR